MILIVPKGLWSSSIFSKFMSRKLYFTYSIIYLLWNIVLRTFHLSLLLFLIIYNIMYRAGALSRKTISFLYLRSHLHVFCIPSFLFFYYALNKREQRALSYRCWQFRLARVCAAGLPSSPRDFIPRATAWLRIGQIFTGTPCRVGHNASMGTCAPRASQSVCPTEESSEQPAICGPHQRTHARTHAEAHGHTIYTHTHTRASETVWIAPE